MLLKITDILVMLSKNNKHYGQVIKDIEYFGEIKFVC